ASGLELRLHEDERAPARSSEPERRRERLPDRDERDVADDQVRCVRERLELARVRPLEHDHARVGAQARVQLPVADVEGDDARGADEGLRLRAALRETPLDEQRVEPLLHRPKARYNRSRGLSPGPAVKRRGWMSVTSR